MKIVRCRKCGSDKVVIQEHWKGQLIEWYPGSEIYDGIKIDDGNPYKVTRKCLNCNHIWVVKNRIQISPEWFNQHRLWLMKFILDISY